MNTVKLYYWVCQQYVIEGSGRLNRLKKEHILVENNRRTFHQEPLSRGKYLKYNSFSAFNTHQAIIQQLTWLLLHSNDSLNIMQVSQEPLWYKAKVPFSLKEGEMTCDTWWKALLTIFSVKESIFLLNLFDWEAELLNSSTDKFIWSHLKIKGLLKTCTPAVVKQESPSATATPPFLWEL